MAKVFTETPLKVYGTLDSGLTIEALLPRHLAGARHPVKQGMILSAGDSQELAAVLAVLATF